MSFQLSANKRCLSAPDATVLVGGAVRANPTLRVEYSLIMNKSQELTVFNGCQKLTSAKN